MVRAAIFLGGVIGGLVLAGAVCGSDGRTNAPSASDSRDSTMATPDARDAHITAEAEETFIQGTADAGYHAPKPSPDDTAEPSRAVCKPDNSTVQTRITPPIYQTPPGFRELFAQLTLVSDATAVDNDRRAYSLYFGYLKANPRQWAIVRWRGAKDVCIEGRPGYDPELYLLPFAVDDVTLTSIDASTLYFATSDGRSGGFDYTSGMFSSSAP